MPASAFTRRDGRPVLALAPMQDITNLPFWKVLFKRGGPDIYWTDYARVHPEFNPASETTILDAVRNNPTGKPAVLQLIGQDIQKLLLAAKAYQKEPIASIDLNLGCPAPRVCRKNAGGALLRQPEKIDAILAALRDAITDTGFTVKTRIGYESAEEFPRLIDIFAKHQLDALSVHGRTVAGRYQTPIDHGAIRRAVDSLPYPVLANGNVLSLRSANETLARTGAGGLMVGRGCIRNPFLFAQIRDGAPPPKYCDILHYIRDLWEALPPDSDRVAKIKRTLGFIGQGVSDGAFLDETRRTRTAADFHRACEKHLDSDTRFPDEPPVGNALFQGMLPPDG